MASSTPAASAPPYRAAGAIAAAVFALYVATLAPSSAMWDTSEYLTAAAVLGIPHPPGNPFFVVLGHLFTLLPIAPTAAARVNVLAALSSALSAGIWFLVLHRIIATRVPAPWHRLAGAAAGTLAGATAFTVWSQSVVNEKVYTVSLLFLSVTSWLAIRWCDAPDGRRADRLLVLIAFLTGLAYTNHPAGFLAAPAIAIVVLTHRPRTLLRWRLLANVAGALALGLSLFLFLPIRAAHAPPLNEGEATSYRRVMDHIERVQYGEKDGRQAPYMAQLDGWWTYFKWQWWRDPDGTHAPQQAALAALFFGLAIAGAVTHWRTDRRTFWYFAPLIVLAAPALVYYLNFKYGLSQAPELGDTVPREVRDRDYFYIWGFSALSVWIGAGLVAVWRALATAVERVMPPRWAWALSAPVLALAAIPAFTNRHAAPRHEQVVTRDFAADLLNSVEPYGILVTIGDNDLFPLWYAQEVEGVRKDVLVVTTALLGTDWYAGQLIRRRVFDYDSAAGPAIYRGRLWAKPTAPPLAMTPEDASRVPEYVELHGPALFRKPGTDLVARIDPARLPYGVLTRSDVFVLHLIADNPVRPVYLSTTDGPLGGELDLEDHLLTQGLARKVVDRVPVATSDTVRVAGAGWFDTSRSLALWDQYHATRTLEHERQWVDRASVAIPLTYVLSGAALATALDMRHRPGDRARAGAIRQASVTLAGTLGFRPPPARPVLDEPRTPIGPP